METIFVPSRALRGALVLVAAAGLATGCGGSAQKAAASGAVFSKGEDGWWELGRKTSGDAVRSHVSVRDFWPGAVTAARQGYLATSDGTPVRALASGYLVPLFEGPDTVFPGGVVDIMKPFRAYYVLRKQGGSLLLAEPPFAPQSRQFWARQSDCYIWATGMAAEVRSSVALHASQEQASSGANPLTPPDKYTSVGRLPPIPGAEASPPLSSLPLLYLERDTAALLCPAYGGELCWVNTTRAGNAIAWLKVP